MAKGDIWGKMPCDVCGHHVKVKETTSGGAYWVCGDCGTRVYAGKDAETAAKIRKRLGMTLPGPTAVAPPSGPAKKRSIVDDIL